MHISVPMANTMEYITNTQVSPFLSKVLIKVCYVGDNRNGTSFPKETLVEMGRNVPGSPIVGYYNRETQDFEEHNRDIELHEDGTYEIIDTTKAYGFVPTDAKVWFQKFVDDGVEHEYLCTEGWLWTKIYEEAQRVISHGNNQSMEIDRDTSKGTWANRENLHKRIFIYNEALIEKLCVLGETYEPCFEGAQIKEQFALHKDELQVIKQDLYAMMNQLKEALEEGGTKVFTTYAVEIGDNLWNSLREALGDEYSIRGVYEEESKTFAVVQKGEEETLYRVNFTTEEDNFSLDADMAEITMDAEQLTFSLEDGMFKKQEEAEDKNDEEDNNDSDDNTEDKSEDEEEKKKYVLDEVTEYVELKQQYEELENKYNALQEANNQLTEENNSLKEFKLNADRKEKQDMIDSFFMLEDEDKQDCIDNIDSYSLADIEAKLSVICVRNKVSFNTEDENKGNGANMFGLNNDEGNGDDGAPAWVKAVRQTQKNKEEI